MAQLKSTNILGNLTVTGEVVASSIKIPGGTGFLKADGSIDNTAYTTATGHTHNYAASSSAGGAASTVAVTNGRSGNMHYIPLTTANSGSQALRALGSLYLWAQSDSEFYLNVGSAGIKGRLTLHSENSNSNGYTNVIPANTSSTVSITLPAVSGTLARTADLSVYLPLTGGDMSGNIKLGWNAEEDESVRITAPDGSSILYADCDCWPILGNTACPTLIRGEHVSFSNTGYIDSARFSSWGLVCLGYDDEPYTSLCRIKYDAGEESLKFIFA